MSPVSAGLAQTARRSAVNCGLTVQQEIDNPPCKMITNRTIGNKIVIVHEFSWGIQSRLTVTVLASTRINERYS